MTEMCHVQSHELRMIAVHLVMKLVSRKNQTYNGDVRWTSALHNLWKFVHNIRSNRYHRLGNFRVKNNSREKFSPFHSIREIFLTVDDCNMDERLESLWLLVYYQVSGKPGIARCSHRSGSVDLRASLFTEYRCVIYFSRV